MLSYASPHTGHGDMIRTIRIRGFKRFDEVEFRLAGTRGAGRSQQHRQDDGAPGDCVVGRSPFQRWRELNDFNRRRGYTRAPIARQAFAAVPL